MSKFDFLNGEHIICSPKPETVVEHDVKNTSYSSMIPTMREIIIDTQAHMAAWEQTPEGIAAVARQFANLTHPR